MHVFGNNDKLRKMSHSKLGALMAALISLSLLLFFFYVHEIDSCTFSHCVHFSGPAHLRAVPIV